MIGVITNTNVAAKWLPQVDGTAIFHQDES